MVHDMKENSATTSSMAIEGSSGKMERFLRDHDKATCQRREVKTKVGTPNTKVEVGHTNFRFLHQSQRLV